MKTTHSTLKIALTLASLTLPLLFQSSGDMLCAQNYHFYNSKQLNAFLLKLYDLETEKKQKINIVHVGDSHIQADLLTGEIRSELQEKFGNAGYGFTFPYSLAGVTSSGRVRYSSQSNWSNQKIISSKINSQTIGLSGIDLIANDSDFEITLSVASETDAFGIVKVFSPEKKQVFSVSRNSASNKVPEENINSYPLMSIYQLDRKNSKQISIAASRKLNAYHLNGIVLEKDNSGIIYHCVGMISGQLSQFNRHDLFFQQLSCLLPDLIIVSFGTNESFSKMSASNYIAQARSFYEHVYKYNPGAAILFFTPPPSALRGNKPNEYIEDYANALKNESDFAVWDMLQALGGKNAPFQADYAATMGKDKVHYKSSAYKKHGRLFVTDLLSLYEKFKRDNNLIK